MAGVVETARRARAEAAATLAVWAGHLLVHLLAYGVNDRFFYRDDVQRQHMGVFSALHRTGNSLSDLVAFRESWSLSYVAAEVQYGVFNPVSWLRDAIAASGDNLARNAMLIAVLYGSIAVLGCWAAARALGLSRGLAAAAALTASLNVHLLMWDAGSWTPALAGFAFFSWFVAALWWTRRDPRWAPAIAVAIFFLATSGWPHAVVAAGLLGAAVFAEQVVRRAWDRRTSLRVACAAIAGVLLAAPALVTTARLTQYTARRTDEIFNTGFLTHDLGSSILSFSPFSQPFMHSFLGTGFHAEPLTYVTWLLPLGAYLMWKRRAELSVLRAELLVAALLVVAMAGPTALGPMRWPFRFQPFAAFLLVMIVGAVFELQRRVPAPLTGFRRLWPWAAGALLLWQSALRPVPWVIAATLLVLAGIWVVAHLAERPDPRLLMVAAVLGSLAVPAYVVVHHDRPTTGTDKGVPDSRAALARDFAGLEGRRVLALIGENSSTLAVVTKSGLLGVEEFAAPNGATLPDANVPLAAGIDAEFINGYSAMQNEALKGLLALRAFGWSTDDTVPRLVALDPVTGIALIDLLGMTAVAAQNGPLADSFAESLPDNWVMAEDHGTWTLFVRPGEQPPVVSHATAGVAVDATSPNIRVAAAGDGSIYLARPWTPDLVVRIDGTAMQVRAHRGVIAEVIVPAGTTGVLRVDYEPAGRTLVLLMVAVGVVLFAVIVAESRADTRRRRRTAVS